MVEVTNPSLTLSTRGELFDAYAALDARLKLAFPARQFAHIVTPAQLGKGSFDALVKHLPVVGVGFEGLTPDRSNGSRYRADAKWLVCIGTRNPAPEGLLLGDKAGGIAQLGVVGLAVALLHGWMVRGLGTWMVGAVQNVVAEWQREDIAMTVIEVSIPIQITDPVAAAALPEFLRLGGQWDLPDLDTADEHTLTNVRAA